MSWPGSVARRRLLQLALGAVVSAAAFELAGCRRPASRPVASTPAGPETPAPPPPPPPLTGQDAALALDALKLAPDHGFARRRFDAGEIERLLGAGVAAERAEGERRLRVMVLDYARAHHGLTIPKAELPSAWSQRASYDAETELSAAIRGGTVRAWLDALPLQTPAYQALQTAYLDARSGKPPPAPPRVAPMLLVIGAQDRATTALRKRLAPEAPELADTADDAPVDEALVVAVKRYQAEHGLEPSGLVDGATAARLNKRPTPRMDLLRANMERLRWMPRPEPATRVEVNIAAAEMDYIRDGRLATHMLAASGKIGDETPLIASAIESIVLNPPWYVPAGIARREILPKGQAYMRARGYAVRDGRVIQRPGPNAALGLVKFDFPNPFAVYLHDTPSKAAFNQSQRAVSHGCVRLARAVELAKTLLAEEPGWSRERVDRVIASGRTTRVKLAQPIAVRLTYATAVAKDGAISYLPDVYGWDAKLLALFDRRQRRRNA